MEVFSSMETREITTAGKPPIAYPYFISNILFMTARSYLTNDTKGINLMDKHLNTQCKNTQYKNTQYNNTQYNNTQYNNTKHDKAKETVCIRQSAY